MSFGELCIWIVCVEIVCLFAYFLRGQYRIWVGHRRFRKAREWQLELDRKYGFTPNAQQFFDTFREVSKGA